MRRAVIGTLLGIVALLSLQPATRAGGISTDGGLTPAKDRVILRARASYVHRAAAWGDASHMDMTMFPLVAAWGLLPELTVMGRMALVHRSMVAGSMATDKTGLADLLLQTKVKVFRVNSRHHVFALAPTLGVEMPVGTDGISSDTWDLRIGAHASYRYRRYTADLTAAFHWNGLLEGESSVPGGSEAEVTLALSNTIPWPGFPDLAVVPVLELGTLHSGLANADSGSRTGTVLQLAPGFQVIMRRFIVEALVQLPVWQKAPSGMLERRIGVISGVRFLF